MELQCVQLLFEGPVTFDFAAIAEEIQKTVKSETRATKLEQNSMVVFHLDSMIQYTDGEAPVQTAILTSVEDFSPESCVDEINQSWRCENAADLIQNSRRTVLVSEIMASLADPQERLRLFHGVLEAVVRVSRPIAMVFKHSQQVVDPKDYLASLEAPLLERPGSLNVRFFQITESPGEMVMDLLGLGAIGLHDLQCHFRDLNPDDVSQQLYGLALYLFENGPVIESGHTIEGVTPGEKWRCQFETSLLPPERELLDLNPGRPYAAGGRI